MVLDKTSRWLYYIDGVSKEIRRMNTNTGSVTGNLTVPPTANEPLAGYYKVEQAVVEVIATPTGQPCGIDYYNDRLIVSDNTTGDIYLYNTSVSPVTYMGTIATGQPGMMGVKVGPDGKIWCVNRTQNAVYRLDVAAPANDLAVTAITSPPVYNNTPNFFSIVYNICYGDITPEINITNTGTAVVSTAEIEYTIDGANTIPFTWNGSLAAGTSTTVSLPTNPAVANGSHLLEVRIVSVNGNIDDIALNNVIDGAFRTINPPVIAPYLETFTLTTFPPDGWNYVHFNPNNYFSRQNAGGFGQSTGSMRMDNYSGIMDITGQEDIMFLPIIDQSALSNVFLRFDVAYAKYNNASNDRLMVYASNDCGGSWTNLYDEGGTALSTAPNSSGAFTPNATQWRTDSVSLSAYSGQTELLLAFVSLSNYGNNLFIDNIFVGDVTTGIPSIENPDFFSIYPNPVADEMLVQFSNSLKQSAQGEIISVEGKVVKEFDVPANTKNLTLDMNELANGFYTIRIAESKSVFVDSFIKN
jgi:hypothetical protein